jgi:hypothetical protein
MKNASILVAAAIFGVGTISFSRSAWALGPVDLEVAARGGIATNLSSGDPNPLGFGLGARAGVDLFTTLYAGVTGTYYFGNSADGISAHSVQYGVEAGYNIYLLKLVGMPDIVGKMIDLRPQIGAGNLTVTAEFDGVSADSSNFYLEPGLVGLVNVGAFLAGVDVNVLWVPNATNANAPITAHAQLGVKF